MSNYAANVDLKNATGIDSFKSAAKSDLASIKAEVDKLDKTISTLAATSALAAVENKITDTNSLFKKTEHKN